MNIIKNIFTVIYSLRRTVMKFAKKIFVGILAVALLISCLALSASAETITRPVKDFKSVLEYRELETYLIEDYEGYALGDFTFKPASSELVDAPVFTFKSADGASESVVADGENKILAVKNASSLPEGYKFLAEEADDLLPRIIMSFDFKSGDGNVGGSDISVLATLPDYFEDVPLFSANLSGEEKSFTYAKYDMNRITYSETVADVTPELNTWYTVDIIYDLVNGVYSIAISSDGESLFSFENPIFSAPGIDSIRLYFSAAEVEGAENVAFLDNFTAYNGSFLRDVTDPENALADLLISIDAYANDPATSIEEKLEIAEAYDFIYANYEVPETLEKDKYDKMLLIKGDVSGFKNRVIAATFITLANNLRDTKGYYDKIEYRDTYVKEYLDMHPYTTVDEYLELDGMSSKYDDRRTYAQAVVDAKKICKAVDDEIEDTKLYCENFVKQVEEGFDFNTDNYELMLSKYNLLSLTASKVDLDYRYSDVNPDTKYPTVGDAYAVYIALENRIAAIEANVAIFVPAVLAMDVTQNESVSAENPYLTANFEDLLENYLTASAVYKNGTVHEHLDPKTYVGGYDLVSAIADYEVKKEYVEGRIAECNTFVSIINGAYASTYFVTVVAELERAALYFDDDKEYSLEKYTGVSDAINTYSLLIERVEKNKIDAQNYINAVNAIDYDASYTELRAKVDAAVALQAEGSVTGYAGVEAADIALAKALSKVDTLEGYSSTLIASVSSLKDAKSLAERRSLIFTALSVKDSAEEAITGVIEAKAALAAAIEAYDSEVAALNALFGEVVSDAAVVITSAVADAGVANVAEAIDKLN